MASYTGVVRDVRPFPGELFPWVNPHAQTPIPKAAARQTWEIFEAEIRGTAAAIGTDDYTYSLGVVRRDSYLMTVYLVTPESVAPDAVNYLTFEIYFNLAQKTHERTTVYGFPAQMPVELTPAVNLVTRQVTKGDTVELVVTGTSAGKAIPGMKVYVCLVWR